MVDYVFRFCRHCGQPIDLTPFNIMGGRSWIHISGFINCQLDNQLNLAAPEDIDG